MDNKPTMIFFTIHLILAEFLWKDGRVYGENWKHWQKCPDSELCHCRLEDSKMSVDFNSEGFKETIHYEPLPSSIDEFPWNTFGFPSRSNFVNFEPNANDSTSVISIHLRELSLDEQIKYIQDNKGFVSNTSSMRWLDLSYNDMNFCAIRPLFKNSTTLFSTLNNLLDDMNNIELAYVLNPVTKLEQLERKLVGLNYFQLYVLRNLKNIASLKINPSILTYPPSETPAARDGPQSQNMSTLLLHKTTACPEYPPTAGGVRITLVPYKTASPGYPNDCTSTIQILSDTSTIQLLPVHVATVCFCIGLILLSIVTFWNRWYLLFYWYRLKRLIKLKNEYIDPQLESFVGNASILYDAYVINSDADGHFVDHQLVPLVQEKLGYNLHTSNKDDVIGGSKADNYFDAIDASRCVIVVFSNSIMKDAWCQFQVDIALMSRVESMGRKKIFVVILDDTNMDSADKSRCVLLTKKTSAKWSDNENSIRQRLLIEELISVLGSPQKTYFSLL
ncbi:toll-like receptor Tollo [Dreissena polymorpha]|uniref:TIR domain-containing protein n=1 Tax=Dreissena polymorpha TaxID=45954 RepID=A0A9D4SB30_DREPO|nr:toll-like receptor Tollo [Dreissena polymorpha]XP_052260328.1 toll-like receptor Tollo [Dreissena polymorpha]KAH3897328.1 hypothetical protein DPMN_021516 [Dreissena polymorpha]